MSFEKKYINYSQYNVPINKAHIESQYDFTNYMDYDGVRYTFRGYQSLEQQTLLENYIDAPIINPSILYAIKSTKHDLYLIFYNTILQNGNYDFSIYFDNKLENSNPNNCLRYFYGLSSSYGYGNIPYYIVTVDNNILWLTLWVKELTNPNKVSSGYQIGINIKDIEVLFDSIESTIESPQYGLPSSSGGYSGGSFDNSSDTIGIPQTPTIGVTNVGFVNVYKTSLNSLQNLGSELFPDFTPPPPTVVGVDVMEALQLGFNNLVENIVNFSNMYINSNLINYVIDCHCLPITPPSGESERIKIGFKEFTQSANKVTSDYVDFDCGKLNIGEYYTNFIDYVGTRAKLYLPFIGFVDIQPEYFQSGVLQVIYRFNIIDGSFMAYVISSSSKSQLRNSVIASYGGNACVHIPITGINYSNMISSVLNGATSIVSGHSKGQVAVNTALDTLASKPPMQSSNGYNATSAYLGIRYPYLIIEREVSNFSEKYTNEYGLPCNITKTINELSGFIQMDSIHLETLTCTDDEKTLIQNLLQNGIIV